MRLSEFKAGDILVDGDGKVFIHDGYVNADGYELPDIDTIINENTSDEFIEKKIKDILGD